MPAKPKTYVETSIVSYLTARPSRDLVFAAQQQITHEWWSTRHVYRLFASQFVIDEAAAGDADAAARRLEALREVVALEIVDEAITLADLLIDGGGLPTKARVDALHVALAAVHGMDYLLTWNCKHIANASRRERIEALCRLSGFEPPVICTPYELRKE